MAVNPISFGSPHARPIGCERGERDTTNENYPAAEEQRQPPKNSVAGSWSVVGFANHAILLFLDMIKSPLW